MRRRWEGEGVMEEKTKVLVIGLDGATWNIIKPLVKGGKLPAIAKLMKNGCYGDLESCIPHDTFPAWKCYSTGRNPGKLGAYWYAGVDMAEERLFFNNSTSFQGKELWDYLGENNITCGVLDMPTTYPCKRINGVMVAHGAPRLSDYTYPEFLERELKNRFDYKISLDLPFEVGKDASIDSTRGVINQRFAVASYLMREFDPSFMHVTIFNIDPIQHFYWRDMEEGDAKYGEVIEDFWTLIDNGMKGILDEFCDERTHIIVMSDHGFTGAKGYFHISKWLTEGNLLKLKRPKLLLSGLFFKLGLSRDNILSILVRTKMASFLRTHIAKETRQKVAALLPAEILGIAEQTYLGSFIDWGRSKVIPTPPGLLYINKKLFGSYEEYEKFKEALIAEIREIEEPKTGVKLAKEVFRGEEIYSGKYIDDAPDIVILPNEGYIITSPAGSDEMWSYPSRGWTGTHKLHGIFLESGPGIKKGIEIEGAKIYDLAPTILHVFGIPIPKDMDGRVLKELFEEGSALAKREIIYQEVDEKARIGGKVRDLKAGGKI
jgi:predicted AlkP superfamily phosphohydrolase/phosphomutase